MLQLGILDSQLNACLKTCWRRYIPRQSSLLQFLGQHNIQWLKLKIRYSFILPLQACFSITFREFVLYQMFLQQILCPQFNLSEKGLQAAVIKQVAAKNELFITSFLRF